VKEEIRNPVFPAKSLQLLLDCLVHCHREWPWT
jgi:hypothetical protein